jgi:Na+-driven multidrug efflux pump
MLTAPILPMLVRLSLPNMMAMLAMALVTIAETAYVGGLGTPPLAGLALVFPLVMLQQMLSGGAMGGGVSSAISRALGACWRSARQTRRNARRTCDVWGIPTALVAITKPYRTATTSITS